MKSEPQGKAGILCLGVELMSGSNKWWGWWGLGSDG